MTALSLVSPPSSSFLRASSDTHFLVGRLLGTSLLNRAEIVRKRCLVVSSRLSALEEAMRIKRSRELQSAVKLKKRPPLRRGKVSGRLPVPEHIPRPSYDGTDQLLELCSERQVHDAEGIAGMRAASELAAHVLDFAGTLVRPSVTTNEIDKAVHKMIIEAGAYPSPLGYGGFPKSICTSVNECVCHGIPDSRQLQNGDIINIDVTIFLNGYHGDTSKTFLCGDVNEPVRHLVEVTEECLERAISICKDGASFKKIGKRISEHAEKFGYGVVERFVGHGIGSVFHSEPLVLHHRNDESGHMVEGQTFTIEPILTMGSIECVTWEDGWTTVTADGSRAAQFEHTILITRTGAENSIHSEPPSGPTTSSPCQELHHDFQVTSYARARKNSQSTSAENTRSSDRSLCIL